MANMCVTELGKYCWVDAQKKILSFSPNDDSEMRGFKSHEEMIQFVFALVERERYRVQ